MDAVEENHQNYLKLNDVTAYKMAFELSNYVWNIIGKWEYFAKDTVGKQFVKAVDSISAKEIYHLINYTNKNSHIKLFPYMLATIPNNRTI